MKLVATNNAASCLFDRKRRLLNMHFFPKVSIFQISREQRERRGRSYSSDDF